MSDNVRLMAKETFDSLVGSLQLYESFHEKRFKEIADGRVVMLYFYAQRIIHGNLANSDATEDEKERLTRMMLRSWLILAGWPDDWEIPQ